jgi:hypothetical protein
MTAGQWFMISGVCMFLFGVGLLATVLTRPRRGRRRQVVRTIERAELYGLSLDTHPGPYGGVPHRVDRPAPRPQVRTPGLLGQTYEIPGRVRRMPAVTRVMPLDVIAEVPPPRPAPARLHRRTGQPLPPPDFRD